MSVSAHGPLAALLAALLAACAPAAEEAPAVHVSGPCEAPVTWAELPDEVRETSGVAASRARPGIFWTHNDSGGDSAVFAIDSAGRVVGRVRVRGATNRDWEDIAVAPCDPGSDRDCLFVGDIGDNNERHARVVVYRIPEPDPATDTVSPRAQRLEAAFPGGPRDAEALFVTDQGIHLVTKGRSQAVELYRLPPPYRPGRSASLRRVQELAPPPTSVSAHVTAAAADPLGRTIVVRSYSGLRFFEPDADTLRPIGRPVDLLDPRQTQGEGVDFIADGRLVLTGEGGRQRATLAVLRCDPRAPPPDTTP